ncbi:hypothetical protein ACFYWN_40850 [Streptomyces sp. NPDC002917]|uniref:hypothetical protein n=1 Tax=Streptomyces sp. NPDC002917 TaxID=3364671 RepID=UPI003676BC2F
MPPKTKKGPELTRSRRPAQRLSGLDPHALAARLYELHNEASKRPDARDAAQEALSRWPGDAAFYNVLLWAQQHAEHLVSQEAQEAAVLRVQLSQLLRERLDPVQLRAVEDARGAGATWERLAPALAVDSVTGAFNKARRLAVTVRGLAEDRRSPEAARALEARVATEALERQRREEAEDVRYPLVQAAARRLLAAFERGELSTQPEDYWITELAEVIDDRTNPLERANLALILRNATAEIYRNTRHTDREAAATDEAGQALEAAASLSLPLRTS